MEKSNSKIVIEDYKDSFVYKKNESNSYRNLPPRSK